MLAAASCALCGGGAEAFALRVDDAGDAVEISIVDTEDSDGRVMVTVDEIERVSEIGYDRAVSRLFSGELESGARRRFDTRVPLRVAARAEGMPDYMSLWHTGDEFGRVENYLRDLGVSVPDCDLTSRLFRARVVRSGDMWAPLTAALSETAPRRAKTLTVPVWLAEACLDLLWGRGAAVGAGSAPYAVSGDLYVVPVIRTPEMARAEVTAVTRETPLGEDVMFLPRGDMAVVVDVRGQETELTLKCRPAGDSDLGALDSPFFGYVITDAVQK